MKDFFSFKKLITLNIASIMYVTGAVLINTVLGLFFFSSGWSVVFKNPFILGTMILSFSLANILWRVMMEWLVVIFSIQKLLKEIRDNLPPSSSHPNKVEVESEERDSVE